MKINTQIKIKLFLIIFIGLIPEINYGQSQNILKGFGFGVNSSFNGELNPIRIVPSLTYSLSKNHFELGVGFNPFDRKTQKLLSCEFNYKHYPNGYYKKFNLYLIARLAYVNKQMHTYYSANYNYIFLNGGFGFDIVQFNKLFIGTNVNLGAFTYSKQSKNPYNTFESKKMFKEIGINLAFQISIGYRF